MEPVAFHLREKICADVPKSVTSLICKLKKQNELRSTCKLIFVMSTSTRKRTNQPPSFVDNANPTNPSDLPPSRPRKKALQRVSPPLSSLSLNKLIYILALFAVLLTAFYSYRIVQYKGQAGGWWNLLLGKRPPQLQNEYHGASSNMNWDQHPKSGGHKWWARESSSSQPGSAGASGGSVVEDRINALAEALGMPPKELASAIAAAVKEYVPSAAAARKTGSSDTMNILLGGDPEVGEKKGNKRVVDEVASGLGSMVETDEPPEA